MNIATERVKASRDKFQQSLPRIQLHECKVEKENDSNVRRLIIEGKPVLLGAIIPNAEIGGLPPLKLMASDNRDVAVGFLKGPLKTSRAIIDYGFTRSECQVEEIVFTDKDREVFDRISRLPVRKKCGNKYFRKMTNFAAWVIWNITGRN